MADSFQSSKLDSQELSSSTKFNNFVQAVEDAINSLDNSNIAAAAAIAVSKLAAGANDEVLTTVASVPTWQAASASTLPAGMLVPYGGSTAPSGWLLCDGVAVSRTTYATLFAVVGTSYGAGDGSTTFNLPDMQGRVAVGKGTHVDVDVIGDSDGEALASRRPDHRHTVTLASVSVDTGAGNLNRVAAADAGGAAGSIQVPAVGPQTAAPLDGPAYLVHNYIIKA